MKFKKIMSLLLVLTLIGTMLTTVTLLNPVAEDTEATTPTTNYNTYVLHAKGATNATTRGIYLNIASAAKIKAGKTYTVSVVFQSSNRFNNEYHHLIIKNGKTGKSLANSGLGTNKGTVAYTYQNQGEKWTVNVTPETADALYLGIYTNTTYLKGAEYYIGAVEVIDENGNNIAISLSPSTTIHAMASSGGQVGEPDTGTAIFEIKKMLNIDDVQDETLKAKLVDNFYIGDTMLNLKGRGATSYRIEHYKQIPASKLEKNTRYNISIKYTTKNFDFNNDNYISIRQGDGYASKLQGEVVSNGFYKEFKAEFTTTEELKSVYIGVFVKDTVWNATSPAEINIADMQFVKEGTTQNLFTPLSEKNDWYCAYNGKPITKFTSANGQIITKLPLDKEVFEPTEEALLKRNTNVFHIKGKGSTGIAVYFIIPKTNIVGGKTYTVSLIQHGTKLSGDNVQLGIRNASGTTLALSNSHGSVTDTYSGAKKWTVKITPETQTALYIGLRMKNAYIGSTDCYIGDIQIVDEDGINVAPQLTSSTEIVGAWHHSGGFGTVAVKTYLDAADMVSIDSVEDATIQQNFFNDLYNGDATLNFKSTTATATSVGFYKSISASKLTSNTKYKLSIKFNNNVNFKNEFRYIALRESTTSDATSGKFSSSYSGEFIEHENYTEYVNYYTTPEIPVSLYIGFFMNSENWKAYPDFNILDIQFIDVNGNNYLTPLGYMQDCYYAYSEGNMKALTTSFANYSITRGYNTDTDPVSTDRKMVNIEGLSNTDGARLYVKLSGVLPGTYQVSYKTKGFDCNGDDSYFAVKTKASGTSDSVVTTAGTNLPETLVLQPSLDEATYKFTTTDFTDIYVGFDVAQSLVPDIDFIIENLELVRIPDGIPSKNLIDENLNLTKWISFNGEYTTETNVSIGENGIYQGSLYKITLMDYDESVLYTEQIVNIKGGKEPKYIIYIDGKNNVAQGVAIFVRVPADKIAANEKYTAKVTVYGKPLNGADSELLIRAGTDNGSTILARTSTGNKGTVTAPATNTVAWTVDITPESATDLYIGIRLNKANTQNADFYIGNVELIDENGDNVAPELAANTVVYNAPSATHTISKWDANTLANYITTQEIIDIDNINNEAIANIFAEYKPEDDDAGSEEKMKQNYQLGKKADGLEPGTYKITMVEQGLNVKDFTNPNFRVVLNGDVKYQTYDEATRQDCVTKVGTNSYKFEATVTVEENDSYIQSEFIVGPYVMSNFNSYVKELSLVKVDDEGNESENLFTDLNVRDWRAANGELLTPDKYNSELQSIKNINLGVDDVNGNGKLDIADIRILSKMQDAGIEVTDATNVTTLRNNLLNAVS